MSINKNDPSRASTDQTDVQIESLESSEIEDVDLEKVSGGMTIGPALRGTATQLTPTTL